MDIPEKEVSHEASAPTLVEVAERAGVNKVTASIVMSGGRGNTRVSEATRQRIWLAAEQLHYQPNALARSLRNRQTHTIGFYMSGPLDMRDLFLSEIASGLLQGCEQNQHDFLMHGTFRNRSTDEIYTHLLNGKIDGLVVHVGSEDPLLSRLAASRLRVIALANPVPNLPAVVVDDAAGSRLLAEYLARKGHRRVLYGASPYLLTSAARRLGAFEQAARELEIAVTVVTADSSGIMESEFLNLPSARRPTALCCFNDQTAYQMIQRFGNYGVRVPDDLAVTGFDGIPSLIPRAYVLTTVRAPWREVAKVSVDLLCQGPTKLPIEETVLPVEFVLGETA